MAVLVTEPYKYATCASCGSANRPMKEFKFLRDVGFSVCVVLCKYCAENLSTLADTSFKRCSAQQIAEANCSGDITECGGACYTRKGLTKEVMNKLKGVKNDKSEADLKQVQ
jgi:hypothetical protein